ncbi:MAG: PDZ domain-containing protein [Betaproteobacteria bacterium]|nr:PDZ domain-containing protein [Betaproteobacteria bacterium]
MPTHTRLDTASNILVWTVLAGVFGLAAMPLSARTEYCPQPGQWLALKPEVRIESHADLLRSASRQRVVLLGEQHDSAPHHIWQLHTLAALYALQPRMVIGFESFPRALQSTLDRWVAGNLTESEFLQQTQWEITWGFDAALYMPLFQFARMHQIPMRALNVERGLVRRVGESGWAQIPAADRQGIGDPEPAQPAYLDILHRAYVAHGSPEAAAAKLDDAGFRRFVDGMLLWDRAMAEALAQPVLRDDAKLAVAIVGRGHVEYGHGIARQLASLGIFDVAALLPWETGDSCAPPSANIADAVFGLRTATSTPAGPRLGVELSPTEGAEGAAVIRVMPGSIAEQTGVLAGDVIRRVAGRQVATVQDVIAVIRRQAPGTWLPLVVMRNGSALELVAKFPPQL